MRTIQSSFSTLPQQQSCNLLLCEVWEVCCKHDMVQTLIWLWPPDWRRYKTLIAESRHLIWVLRSSAWDTLTITTTTTREARWAFNFFSKSWGLRAMVMLSTWLSITNDLVKQMILSLTSTFNQVRRRPCLSDFWELCRTRNWYLGWSWPGTG